MSIEFETIADNCTPRNALFCCRSPVCLNNSPKLVPVTSSTMDSPQQQHHQQQNQSKVFPVCVPDLSDAGFYTNLVSHPMKLNNDTQKIDPNLMAEANGTQNSKPNKMLEINKSQSAQDIRHYGVSLRRVTPPKCTVSVKKNDNPMMNVVLRKVLYIAYFHHSNLTHYVSIAIKYFTKKNNCKIKKQKHKNQNQN